MGALGVLLGIALPVAGGIAVARMAGGAVATVAVLSFSAGIESVWPLGGGMTVEGTHRVRFVLWERTFDAQRSALERSAGPFLLALVTVGGFFVYVPLGVVVWRALGPWRPGVEELAASATVVAALVIAVVRNPKELPLRRWRNELEATPLAAKDQEIWRDRVLRIARICRPNGGIGHLGGIGARTVGLHETLDAERILRAAEAAGIPEAATLRERSLEYIKGQQLADGGFPVYPGGLARDSITERARQALQSGGARP